MQVFATCSAPLASMLGLSNHVSNPQLQGDKSTDGGIVSSSVGERSTPIFCVTSLVTFISQNNNKNPIF